MEGAKKRQKITHTEPNDSLLPEEKREVRIKFRDTDGVEIGDEIAIDFNSSKVDLNKILD